MRRVLTILVTVTTIMTVTAGAASAGRGDNGRSEKSQVDKIHVCHYDADTDEFHLINVNSNALASHLAHDDALPDTRDLGDECRVSTAAELATQAAQGNFLDGGLEFRRHRQPDDLVAVSDWSSRPEP